MRSRHHPRRARPIAAAFVLALLPAVTALAQDVGYTVTEVSDRYVAPPDDATQLSLGDDTSARVSLPFTFPYFGAEHDDLWVHSNGFVQIGVRTGSQRAFFTRNTPLTGDEEGLCGPYWTDTDPSSTGRVLHWVEGSAPNRTFYVGWENVASKGRGGDVSFQVQLSEGSGDIVFAYQPLSAGGDWGPFGGFIGQFVWIAMDAPQPKDARAVEPGPFFAGSHPGTDFLMEPVVRTYSGSVTYDELVSDANGIGRTVREDVPLEGLRAALVWLNGVVTASAPIAADGSFSLTTRGIDPAATGSIELLVQTDAATLFGSGLQPVARVRLVTGVSFKGDRTFGRLEIDANSDPQGAARAGILSVLQPRRARDWLTSRLDVDIPTLIVSIDPAAPEPTEYAPADDEFGARLRIAGPAAPNPDLTDEDVMLRAYGRHVLATLAAHPDTEQDDRFDVASDRENAFAVAFGHYLAAAVSGRARFVDGLTADSATVLDLESPTFSAPPGSHVAGRVAASLFDLLDASNEAHDEIDGSSVPESVVEVVDGFTGTVTAEAFLEEWARLGHDGPGFARILAHHRALMDDADESNDTPEDRVELGPIGVRVDGRVLNLFNEDWYGIELPEAVTELEVAALYDRDETLADVTVELYDAAGTLLAGSDGDGAAEGVRFSTDALSAGSYRIRIRHGGGTQVADYTVQAQEPFVLAAPELADWTVGRLFDQPLFPRGGVGPYAVSAAPAQSVPNGLEFLADPARVTGVLFEAGQFTFTLRVVDSARPQNEVLALQRMTINDRLRLSLGPVVGFPVGRAPDIDPNLRGGTPPLTPTLVEGGLPPGITLDPDGLVFGGSAQTPGTFDFRLSVSDAAGSLAAASVRGVVAVAAGRRKAPVTLASGDQAAGYYFDAVAGTRVTFTASTARRQPRRQLDTPLILGPGGAEVEGGPRRASRGRASARAVVVPTSGRHFFITGSAAGDETTLLGRVRLAPPRRLRDAVEGFGGGDKTEVEFGALAGARLLVRATPERGSGLVPSIEELIAPDGTRIDVTDLVSTTRRGALVLRTKLETGGTWRVVFGSAAGARGDLAYLIKLVQPRKGVFTAD